MARALLATQNVGRPGAALVETTGDPTDNHYLVNDGGLRTFLYVRNAGVSSRTVTVITPLTIDGLAVGDMAITIPAGETRLIGPFPSDWYNDITGNVQVDVSHADLKLAAALLPAG